MKHLKAFNIDVTFFFPQQIKMKDYVYVVAIDFGTSYSGYAFSVSLPGTRLADVDCLAPLKWNAGADTLTTVASEKTPTCLLLTIDKQIVAFGYEAENKYAEITINGQQDLYLFFHRFKMSLYKCKVCQLGSIVQIRKFDFFIISIYCSVFFFFVFFSFKDN